MSAVRMWKKSTRRWLRELSDDTLLQWLLRGMIAVTVVVVALDYQETLTRARERDVRVDVPIVQPAPEHIQPSDGNPTLVPQVPNIRLRERMTFELTSEGRLLAVGSISAGTANSFAEEIDKRGSYVKTVVLESPGGSVHDALVMGRLIRKKGFFTEVAPGKYCASSCPLVFAGGVERRAGKGAAIGVHQISTIGQAQADEMAAAQRISALCQKYLQEMGVDLGVWVHAMETPKSSLYYFKPAELQSLKLVTTTSSSRGPG
jgi:hypothetical protein